MLHLKPVTVGRYDGERFNPHPDFVAQYGGTFLGWIETEDWIVLEHEDGTLWVYNGRGAEGEVTGPGFVMSRGPMAEMAAQVRMIP